jgi:predicted metal-dependent RNase
MLFSLHRQRPLFTVNPVLNDYIKKNNEKYIRDIVKTIEYKNQKQKIFGDDEPKQEVSLVIPSIFLLSLTTIIYYFYSKRS